MKIKRRLMWWLYKHEANAVTVGTSNHPTATSNPRAVVLAINGNPVASEICLTPEGARLVSKQLTEWADFCETANKEHAEQHKDDGAKMIWKVMVDAADIAKKLPADPAPVAGAS